MNLQINTLKNTVSSLKIAVIGDAILDSYVYGTTHRISQEAPVPIVDVDREEYLPGGAANVAVNCATLGGQVEFFSVVGDDEFGDQLRQLLMTFNVDVSHVLVQPHYHTPVKKRVSANDQIKLRFDYGSHSEVATRTAMAMVELIVSLLRTGKYGAVILSDYGYGVVSDELLLALTNVVESVPLTITADSKYLLRFAHLPLSAVKPNYSEACALLDLPLLTSDKDRVHQIKHHGPKLHQLLSAQVITVTLDQAGALVFDRTAEIYRTYAQSRQHSHNSGAGDTYISALTLGLAAGVSTPAAAEFAAAACNVVTEKPGTAPCYVDELHDVDQYSHKRVFDHQMLRQLVSHYQRQNQAIVFTNGCFDILHRGHVSYLNQAKALGGVLIVGVNTDETIKILKGPQRPINTLDDRLRVLSALSSVDHVVPFTERTPINLIELIKPDVYVKGGDYTRDQLPEVPVVEGYGGEVKLIEYIPGTSTTTIINRIQSSPLITDAKAMSTSMSSDNGREKLDNLKRHESAP